MTGVRPGRRYEKPIGVALDAADAGETVPVRLDGEPWGVTVEFRASTDVDLGQFVALDFGFWKRLIGGTRQAFAGWLRRLARRVDYRP